MREEGKKLWSCSTSCKIDFLLIERYQKFLNIIYACTFRKISQLMQTIYKCTVNISSVKQGHTQSCYTDPNICKATFLPVQLLLPHFPKVRNIKRLVYQFTDFYHKLVKLNKALLTTTT